MSLNKVMLIGNAGKDPDVRHLESGVVKASFTLATTERYKDRNGELKEQTEWHNIVCWRNLAEVVERFVKKGTQVYVEGKITTRQYTDQTGTVKYITEIAADSLQLLGRRPEGEGAPRPAQNAWQPRPSVPEQPAYQTAPQPAYQPAYQAASQPAAPQAPSSFQATAPAEDDADDLPF